MISNKKITILLDGVDGSGKTTQSILLFSYLKQMGLAVSYVKPVTIILNIIPKKIKSLFISLWQKKLGVAIRARDNTVSKTSSFLTNSTVLFRIIMFFLGILFILYALLSYFIVLLKTTSADIVIFDRYFYYFLRILLDNKKAMLLSKLFPSPTYIFFLKISYTSLQKRLHQEMDLHLRSSYYLSLITWYNTFYDYLKRTFRNLFIINAEHDITYVHLEIVSKVSFFLENKTNN